MSERDYIGAGPGEWKQLNPDATELFEIGSEEDE